MGLLIRMIEKQKWEKVDLVQLGYKKTPGDTITTELKTSANTLSLWFVDNVSELFKAVLALAVGRNKITRLDIMIFEEYDLVQNGLIVENTPENGHCPIEEYNDFHYDIINLDFEKLGKISELIISNLNLTEKCIRFDKSKISDILYDAYSKGAFSLEELSESLVKDLKKVISRKELNGDNS
jgi:hypothetical protein